MHPDLSPKSSDDWARDLHISREAIEIYRTSDVIDLHVDSFIWQRVFGYDLRKRHEPSLFGGAFYGQVDFPRILEARVTGATWVITTNPLRDAQGRAQTFLENVRKLRELFDSVSDEFAIVRSASEYREARNAGKHGAFIGVQGGNAFDYDPSVLDTLPDGLILRVTLVHLSNSRIGTTSSPLKRHDAGLGAVGHSFIEALESRRVLVDLAHISKRGFWEAVQLHKPTQPLVVTHTGVSGVHPHWRNLDDEQLRAIAETGGTIGIMYHSPFLGDPTWRGRAESVVHHIEHVVNTVGEDFASLGSDFDGAIVPPRDLKTCLELPRLVELMLKRGFNAERIQKILGGNFLRVVAATRDEQRASSI